MKNLNTLIGNNLNKIRKDKDFNLDQVAQLTGVSKSMLSQIEKGKKTPTITTLWKIASGLNISLSKLMDEKKSSVSLISSKDSFPLIEDDGKFKTSPFIPYEDASNFEVFKMELEPNCKQNSNPHSDGVKEYIFISEGTLTLKIDGELFNAESGDALVFNGDVFHTYINNSNTLCSCFVLISYQK